MKLPAVSINATGVLVLAGVLVGAYALYRASKGVNDILKGAGDALKQAQADVTSAWNNATSAPPAPGEKAFLYSDQAYTGIDPATGQLPTAGEWYGNADARRYDYQQRDAGAAPAATSNDGAAFGIYPSSGRRKPLPVTPTTGDFSRLDRLLTPDTTTNFNGA